MKNYRTPRGLAESSFEIGYETYSPSSTSWSLKMLGYAALLVCMAAIGVILGWRG